MTELVWGHGAAAERTDATIRLPCEDTEVSARALESEPPATTCASPPLAAHAATPVSPARGPGSGLLSHLVEHSAVRPDMATLKLAWDACYMPHGPMFPSHLLPPPSPPAPSSLPSSSAAQVSRATRSIHPHNMRG